MPQPKLIVGWRTKILNDEEHDINLSRRRLLDVAKRKYKSDMIIKFLEQQTQPVRSSFIIAGTGLLDNTLYTTLANLKKQKKVKVFGNKGHYRYKLAA